MADKPFLFCLLSSLVVSLCGVGIFFIGAEGWSLIALGAAIAAMAILSKTYAKEPDQIPARVTQSIRAHAYEGE